MILPGKGRVCSNGVLARQAHVDGVTGFQAGLRELVAILTVHVLKKRALLMEDARCFARDDEIGE